MGLAEDLMGEIYKDLADSMFVDIDKETKSGETVQLNIDEPKVLSFAASKFRSRGYVVEQTMKSLTVTKR